MKNRPTLLGLMLVLAASGCAVTENFSPSCGDGRIDQGEMCDDGNTVGGDGCSANCLSDETCGNLVVDDSLGEACDDGNLVDGDGCQADCSLPTCGDGVIDDGERCDQGADNGTGEGKCTETCMAFQFCGDSITNGTEACDDGPSNGFGEGFCVLDCTAIQTCGDGEVQGTEICDDGDDAAVDFCGPSCVPPAKAYLGGANQPWGNTENQMAMDIAFGAGAWDEYQMASVDVGALFSTETRFVYLDGSDSNALELSAFLAANLSTIEAWVDIGGRLFLNAAPNEGGNIAFGFGDVLLNYPGSSTNPGNASDPGDAIWLGPNLPTATSFTGSSYAHAYITGTGTTPLIQDSSPSMRANLAELTYGMGDVIFGGLTTTNFWTPTPESRNLRANVCNYLHDL